METKLKNKTTNQINTIHPYRTEYGWAFDDEEVGLFKEAFVGGMPELIDSLVEGRDKFTAHISKDSFPSSTGILDKISGTGEDGWYRLRGTEFEGWCCPALLKYFSSYPEHIHFQILKT